MRSLQRFVGAAFLVSIGPIALGQEIHRREVIKAFDQPIYQIAFAADGRTVAAGGRGLDTKTFKRWTEFGIWDTVTHKKFSSFQGHAQDSSAIALSPDGSLLLSSTSQGQMLLWSVKKQEERNIFNLKGGAPTVAFSFDGLRLAAASIDGLVHATYHGDEPQWQKFRGRYSHRAFTPDVRYLAAACHQDVDLYETSTGKLHGVLPDHPGTVYHISFSEDGTTAAAVVRTADETGYGTEIFVWDFAKKSVRARLKGVGFCTSAGLAHGGKTVLIVTDKAIDTRKHELRAIDVATGKTTSVYRFPRDQTPHSVAFCRDGRLTAVGASDGTLQLFDLK